MDFYSRCESHGISRCHFCNPRPSFSLQQAPVSSAPAGFDPSDLLDGPVAVATAPATVSAPPELDPQARDALERQKEINASRSGVSSHPASVDEIFGADVVDPVAEPTKQIASVPEPRSLIVEAARQLALSETDYNKCEARIKRAELELVEARSVALVAAERRTRDKDILRALVQDQ
jgi:hypothetical protein